VGPKRLLLVDDNVDLATVFSLMLERRGYEVMPAHSVDQALSYSRFFKFDLVICDIIFAHKSGYVFLESFREVSNAPVLATSAWTLPKEREKALAAGFADLLPKPLLIEKLVVAIEGALIPSASR